MTLGISQRIKDISKGVNVFDKNLEYMTLKLQKKIANRASKYPLKFFDITLYYSCCGRELFLYMFKVVWFKENRVEKIRIYGGDGAIFGGIKCVCGRNYGG